MLFDYGNATPDNRFSYYYSFNGDRENVNYGNGTTWYPLLDGSLNYESGNDNALNLFYHWGASNQNELQYYADFGSNLFNQAFQINPAHTPYPTNNKIIGLFGGLGSGLSKSCRVPLLTSRRPIPHK